MFAKTNVEKIIHKVKMQILSTKNLGIIGMALGPLLIIAALLMGIYGFPSAGFGPRKIFLGLTGLRLLIAGTALIFASKKLHPSNKKIMDSDFQFTNVLIPLTACIFYCITFVYISSTLQLTGVTYNFFNKLWVYGAILLTGLLLVFYENFKIRKTNKLTLNYAGGKIHISDMLLLFLPLVPVVQYILNNPSILTVADSLIVILFFTLFSGLYIFFIPLVLGVMGSTRILMILGLTFVTQITFMATMSTRFAWYQSGNFWVQLIVFISVFTVTLVLFTPKRKWFLYAFLIIFFVTNSVMQLKLQVGKTDSFAIPDSQNALVTAVLGKKPYSTPNIYLLIYDSYVTNETMLAYGIDNHLQEDYLQEEGFKLYPQTYSILSSTSTSMDTILNAANSFDPKNIRKGISGNGNVQNILKNDGYKTFGIFPSSYMFKGVASRYDVSVPENVTPSYVQLGAAILMGEFRFDLDYGGLSHKQFVETKREIFEDITGDKVFVYTHSDLPSHSQNSGACRINEIELFRERLIDANNEMRQDVFTIVEHDPGAIVIVAGDHGPHLTKNCRNLTGIYDISEISRLDIQDRYGTFLAIRWPTKDFSSYDHITVLQDLFPTIFAYLYKDENILESRISPVIPVSLDNEISGVSVINGMIHGGINDGESLFINGN